MSEGRHRIGVIGASGYTGADLVRLAARHPAMEIAVLTANSQAGKTMAEVFPHLAALPLPRLVKTEDVNWDGVEAVFCGLPHAASQEVIATLPDHLKIIDMSADFRFRDPATYERWYGGPHKAAGAAAQRRLRPDGALSRGHPPGPAGGLSRLLPDGRSDTGAAAGQGRADRCRRSHHRCQVGRFGSRPHAQAEHAVLRGGGGACRPMPWRATGTPPRSSRRSRGWPATPLWSTSRRISRR